MASRWWRPVILYPVVGVVLGLLVLPWGLAAVSPAPTAAELERVLIGVPVTFAAMAMGLGVVEAKRRRNLEACCD